MKLQEAFDVLILAAGRSSRMGSSKQMLLIDGVPLLKRTVQTALESDAHRVTVVLGAEASTHQSALQGEQVDVVINDNWARGPGSSIHTGIAHILSVRPETAGVIITTCDQPRLTGEHLNNLLREYKASGKQMVASRYADTVGVPAFFHRSMFDALLTLDPATGAKPLLAADYANTGTVAFDGGEVDLDTPEDYHRYLNRDL